MRSLFDALESGAALAPDLSRAFGSMGAHRSNDAHDESDADDEAVDKRYRTIFISDLHLGTPGCQATALLDFFKGAPERQPVPGRRHR